MSVVILSGLYASAQFLVFTELQKDEEDKYSVNSLSENLSFGYAITDKIYVGASMKDAVANTPATTADSLDAGGIAGTVVEIGLFNTEIKTNNGLSFRKIGYTKESWR